MKTVENGVWTAHHAAAVRVLRGVSIGVGKTAAFLRADVALIGCCVGACGWATSGVENAVDSSVQKRGRINDAYCVCPSVTLRLVSFVRCRSVSWERLVCVWCRVSVWCVGRMCLRRCVPVVGGGCIARMRVGKRRTGNAGVVTSMR